MAKRKKRNAITLVSLLLALTALIAVYFWYDNYKANQEKQKNEVKPTIDLATVDTTNLKSLHVIMKDADLALVLLSDQWVVQADPYRPLNQDYVNAMLSAIKNIKADRIIMEHPDNLADYGLAEPAANVTATMADGTTVAIKIGSAAGQSQGYYGMVNNDGIVYLLPIQMGSAFQYSDVQMTATPKSPDIQAANINHITIDNSNGENYELQLSDDKKLDNTGNNMYTWQILKPYGEGYTADSTKLSGIANNYTTFNYISCVDYRGTDLSKYGLDNPAASIDIGYFVPRTVTLDKPETEPTTGKEVTEKTINDPNNYKVYVGNKDDNGNYYVMLDGSQSVFTMSAEAIDTMLKIDAFGLLNPSVLIPNIDAVDQVTCDIQGTTYTMKINHTTTTDKDGKEKKVETFYYNGMEVKDEDFRSLYKNMISATYDSELKDQANTNGVEPYMTITFHLFGDNEGTYTASFLPYNDSFDIVKKGNDTRFLVDKRKVEDIAAAVLNFTGTNTKN